MKLHTTRTNILKIIEIKILEELEKWDKLLFEGNLYSYENAVHESLLSVFNYLGQQLLPQAAEEAMSLQKEALKGLGCQRLEQRKFRIRLSTGYEVKVGSYYAREVPDNWTGSRHSISRHWKIIGNGSPGLYDRVGFSAALGPSYDLGQQALSKFNTKICLSSVRDINNQLADHCFTQKEEDLIVESEESLEDMRQIGENRNYL